jgi:hypothetical protein
MTPRRKKQRATTPAFKRGREFKVILPPDISERIEKQAKDEGKPQSRIIINDLARIPDLDRQAKLGQLTKDMEVVLTRYHERIIIADLTDDLLRAAREIVKADDTNNVGVLRSKVAKVRATLAAIEKHKPKQDA